MDLFVLGTIVVVFLVLLAASLLVNKMPSGKTFEEVQAEKKLLADQMKQQSRPAKQKGGTQSSGKAKAKPVTAQANASAPSAAGGKKGKNNNKGAVAAAVKIEEVETPHVEFVAEEIYLGDDMPVVKKSLSSTGLNKQGKSKKGSKASSSGILVNKTETSPASKDKEVVPESANHFEEIHPKDDVEMLRTNKDEPNKGGKPHKNAVNELRKEKKAKTKAEKPKTAVPSDIADIEGVEQIIKANEQKLQKRNTDAVDSVRGGKRGAGRSENGLQALQKLVDGTDEISVSVLIKLLGKAELSRSEIQLVIEYLLNKQSDSVGVINSEWTEGKQDMVQRLKKQLAERETQLQNEQEAAAAIHEKLKLLRLELNQEKTQNGNTAKMYMWEMAQKEKDLELMMAKLNAAAAEKATMLAQMQKMQLTLVQQKNAIGAQDEHQRELEMYKNTVQAGKVDMRNLENELDSARNEILQLRQQSFEVTEQMNRERQVLSGQVSTLKLDASNYESLLSEKSAAQEQLEEKLAQLKGNEETLCAQLEELKQKNNELEGLVKERVQQAEKELKDKFTHLLTQISVFSNLKLENNGSTTTHSSNSSSSNGDSSNGTTTADLDPWMSRVPTELKKKLDVYESLLGTLRQQLQDKREKEIMSVGVSQKSSSAKFVSGAELAANGSAEKNGNGTEKVAAAGPEGGDQSAASNGNGTEVTAAT